MFTQSPYPGKTTAAFSGLLIFFMLISMAAADSPSFPCSFYGSATINGRAVPASSVITAEIDGAVRGAITLSEDGIYGRPVLESRLVVENGKSGDTIVFFVQTPQMSNRLQAAETATYSAGGDSQELDLTFTGEEIPKPSGGSSSGSGGSGGSATTPEQSQAEQPPQGAVNDIDLSDNEPVEVELANKDSVNIIIDDSSYTLTLKSMSDFSVLLDYQGENIVLGVEETKEIDLNGDYVTDIEVTLDRIDDGKAFLTFSALDKDAVEAGIEGITGYASANPIVPGLITIIIIGAFGISAYKFRRRGSL